jgi:hypothetical protein
MAVSTVFPCRAEGGVFDRSIEYLEVSCVLACVEGAFAGLPSI